MATGGSWVRGLRHACVMAGVIGAYGSIASNAAAQTSEAAHGSVFVDPLGFALFGPRLGAELGAGHFSGALSARWFNAGLLAHSLFLTPGDAFALSYSGGIRGRYYTSPELAGAHFGVVLEYLHSRVENQGNLVATNANYVVPYAEVGYRLPFGAFYADGSAGLGYAAQASSHVENLPGGQAASAYRATDNSSVCATASLDLGLYF